MRDPNKVLRHNLQPFNNLKYLELFLHGCCSWKILTMLLMMSPNLEQLFLQNNLWCHFEDGLCYGRVSCFVYHVWYPPDRVCAYFFVLTPQDDLHTRISGKPR